MPVQNVTSLLLMRIFERIKCLHQVIRGALLRNVVPHHSYLRHRHYVVSPLLGGGEAGRPHVQGHGLLSVDQKVLLGSDGNRMGRVPVMFAYFDQTAGQNDLEIVVVNSSDHI